MLVESAHELSKAVAGVMQLQARHEAVDLDTSLTWTIAQFTKEQQIYSEGDPSNRVYQIVRGAVRSCKLLSDGRCQITAFHLPGDIFDADVKDVHPTSAEAIVDTTVRTAKRQMLEQAALTNASISSELWYLTASKLRHAEDHLLLLGRKTALERVAAFLVEMNIRLKCNGNLPLPMRRRDIGDYLGLTLETVSRVLSVLHGNGTIDFAGSARQIVIRNGDRLRRLVGAPEQ